MSTTAPSSPLAPAAGTEAICAGIIRLLLPHRRTTEAPATAPDTPEAFPWQARRLARFVASGDPVVFALPGFPCKSPNPEKVLGHLPDEGERLSLRFLDDLCARVRQVYAPGARVLICSDGHVFGDLIHVPDEHIDAYGDALRRMIADEGLGHLDTFDLRDVYGDGLSYDEKRRLVSRQHAPTLEELRAEVRADATTLAMYRGITRFLVADTVDFAGSRSALQRDCRRRAYGVIQRSRAWGGLIDEHHPRAVRLSIHPQPRGAAKFGIRLLDAADAWTTPWHAAVLRRPGGGPVLMPRAEAERLGRLVHRDGRPSHFEAFAAGAGHRPR
ncbi:L-tyrosine/L-tryptophan isonitrile synthase family protein [Streptomyces specialis]|uniref:L-tyrosine/L-tryptophan isonitrile synthase family protein n=1 Tax=Streptomyces specialis TaxID=498367 RepID=UPI00073F34F6|nr:isocyanide synthase family protein [Streptomyces specialis]